MLNIFKKNKKDDELYDWLISEAEKAVDYEKSGMTFVAESQWDICKDILKMIVEKEG